MFPYFAVSPVITTTNASLARSSEGEPFDSRDRGRRRCMGTDRNEVTGLNSWIQIVPRHCLHHAEWIGNKGIKFKERKDRLQQFADFQAIRPDDPLAAGFAREVSICQNDVIPGVPSRRGRQAVQGREEGKCL